jgi:transcriptional regulator with XRE-family HTH domain
MTSAKPPQNLPQITPQVLAGRTMRMMRQAHRVGLREMAGLVGISPSHLSRVEKGERAAGPELTDRICQVIAELPSPSRESA